MTTVIPSTLDYTPSELLSMASNRNINDTATYVETIDIKEYDWSSDTIKAYVYMQVISGSTYQFHKDKDRFVFFVLYPYYSSYFNKTMINYEKRNTIIAGKSNNLYGSFDGFAESEYTDGGKEISHCDVQHHNVFITSLNHTYVRPYRDADYVNSKDIERQYYEC